MILIIAAIDFSYEPQTFPIKLDGKLLRYTPDFRLNDSDGWIEIKGRQRELGIRKFQAFSEDANRTKMILKDDLEFICKISTSKMSTRASNDGFDALFDDISALNTNPSDVRSRLSNVCGWPIMTC